jgi:hypothetical protein
MSEVSSCKTYLGGFCTIMGRLVILLYLGYLFLDVMNKEYTLKMNTVYKDIYVAD